MKCPKCSRAIDDDSSFCMHCGADLAPPAHPSNRSRAKHRPDSDPHDLAEERHVWEGRRSWRSYYGVWALAVTCWLIAIVIIYRLTDPGSSLRTWVWGLGLAAWAAVFVQELLLVFGQRYRMTTQRLFVDRGILMRITDQTELMRIDDVRIKQGVVDRIVDTGDVEILGSDATDARIVLKSISRPAEVAEELLKHVRIHRKRQLLVEHV